MTPLSLMFIYSANFTLRFWRLAEAIVINSIVRSYVVRTSIFKNNVVRIKEDRNNIVIINFLKIISL